MNPVCLIILDLKMNAFNYCSYLPDLEHLNPEEWLDDGCINAFAMYAWTTFIGSSVPSHAFVGTSFDTVIIRSNIIRDLFERRICFFPFNVESAHWALVIVLDLDAYMQDNSTVRSSISTHDTLLYTHMNYCGPRSL
jgi:Ulp1 family protease